MTQRTTRALSTAGALLAAATAAAPLRGEPTAAAPAPPIVLSDDELHRLLNASPANANTIHTHAGERVVVLARSLGWLDATSPTLRLTSASATAATADPSCEFKERPATAVDGRLITVSGTFHQRTPYLGLVALDDCHIQ